MTEVWRKRGNPRTSSPTAESATLSAHATLESLLWKLRSDDAHLTREIGRIVQAWPDAIHQRNTLGNLPLHSACRWGCSLSVIRILHKANDQACRTQGCERRYPLHYACMATPIADDVVRFLLQCDASVANIGDETERTPLHYAAIAYMAPAGFFVRLIDANPAALLHKDKYGSLPLHWLAMSRGNMHRTVPDRALDAFLLGNEATLTVKDNYNMLALENALTYKHTKIVAKLIDRIVKYATHLKEHRPDKFSDLFQTYCSLPKVLERFCEEWKDLAQTDFGGGNLPLHLICNGQGTCNQQSLEFITKLAPSTIAERNDDGQTPLHCLLQRHAANVPCVKALISACPKVVYIQDSKGQLPLHLACKVKEESSALYWTLVNLVHSQGLGGVHQADRCGTTPLVLACQRCAEESYGDDPLALTSLYEMIISDPAQF